MDGIQPTLPLNMGNDGFGSGSGIWLFALLILFGMGGFGGFGRNNFDGRAATVEDLNNSANFTRLESQVANNGMAIAQKADALGNGIASLGYEVAQQFGNTNTTMASGFCGISKEILDSKYATAMNIGASESNISAQINALSQKIDQNKIEALQAKVNELQLAQATGNVVRYPNAWTYNAGNSPFCNCYGCCNNGNI